MKIFETEKFQQTDGAKWTDLWPASRHDLFHSSVGLLKPLD